ncbi:MAG: IS1182 family transposase [Thermodesulfobacteriota bacterium]
MVAFVQGAARGQVALLPECLDDWVDESNSVRAVDVFVDALDLRDLGFAGIDPAATGRPAYHPATMLKLYIYGYLNRVQSSRRLEREAGRNLEVIWLLGKLAPDHKTIADFRKDNGPAIRQVCAQFVELCRQMGLLANASVAIDGSKFKAVNSRDNNFTKGKLERRLKQIEESVARYLGQIETADRRTAAGDDPSEAVVLTKTRLKEKLAKLEEEVKRLREIERQVQASPDGQVSLTDPDCRSMATSGRGSGMVAYNVQSAVDTKHHLIVAHEVTNVGTDRSQLASMANAAKDALRTDKLDAIADRGYFKGQEILACKEAGITVTLPKPQTSGAKSKGRFGKPDFVYLSAENVYRCPADEKLQYRYTSNEGGLQMRSYWTNACASCAIKSQCTTGKERRVKRWEHEHVVEAVQERLDKNPQAMRVRRETVEHPFATLKMRMGATHFLCKTLPKVAAEMALNVLGYNLTRVLNIVGVKALIKAIEA